MSHLNLSEIFTNVKLTHEDQGIEIETECDLHYDIPPNLKFFNAIRDGSLRGNMPIEYVLKKPVSIKDMKDVLAYLDGFFRENKISLVKDSISTSIHVHLNMSDKKLSTIGSFITTWILLETLMLRYSGPTRVSNFFCLPFKDAKGNLDSAKRAFKLFKDRKYSSALSFLTSCDIKYAALNIKPLSNLGTLEIRCFRGETNFKLINEWCNILDTLVQYSQNRLPTDIIEDYRIHGNNFPVFVLGDDYGNKLLKNSENPEKDIKENLMMAAQFVTCVPDWSKLGTIPKKRKIPKGIYTDDLMTISNSMFKKTWYDLDWAERLVVEDLLEKRLKEKYMNFEIVDPDGDE